MIKGWEIMPSCGSPTGEARRMGSIRRLTVFFFFDVPFPSRPIWLTSQDSVVVLLLRNARFNSHSLHRYCVEAA